MNKYRFRRNIQYEVFLIPALVSFTLFTIIPLIKTMIYSFTDFDGVLHSYQFVGLKNYIAVFHDDVMKQALFNTLFYTFFVTLFVNLISIPLAVLLDRTQRVKTFERAFVADRSSWKEQEDPYFSLTEDPEVCDRVLAEFGLSGPHAHIINGHKPVRQRSGESPVKGGGKRLVVDGGFCEAYHRTTGIAGYTLISTANSLSIKAHRPFLSVEAALAANADILSNTTVIERPVHPLRVADTDRGRLFAQQAEELEALLAAYRSGDIAEHTA